jgi:hypothetical protein
MTLNTVQSLLSRKMYQLDSSDYDDLFQHPDETFLVGFTDQPSLKQLSKEIWKLKPNKRKLYQCFTTLFASPIYRAALGSAENGHDEFAEFALMLKKLKNLSQSMLVQIWAQPTLPEQMHCVLVILKQALLQKTLLQELVILLLFRPTLMHDLAMRDKSTEYMKTKEFLDKIEISWFFGRMEFSKTSLTEFYEALKQDKELYGFFMMAVKKELGLGRDATEEETYGYLKDADVHKVANAIVEEFKKEPHKAQYYIDRFKKFCEEHMPEDLKKSLEENPIVSTVKKMVVRA